MGDPCTASSRAARRRSSRAGAGAAARRLCPGGARSPAAAANRAGAGRGEPRRGPRRRRRCHATSHRRSPQRCRSSGGRSSRRRSVGRGATSPRSCRCTPTTAPRLRPAVRRAADAGGPGLLLPVGRRRGLGRRPALPDGARRSGRRGRGRARPRGRARGAEPARALDAAAGAQPGAVPDDPAGGDGRLLRRRRARAPGRSKPVAGLPIGADERDQALLALIGFRDPLGVDAAATPARTATRSTGSRRSRTAIPTAPAACARDDPRQPAFTQRRVRLGGGRWPAAATCRWTQLLGGVRAGRPALVQHASRAAGSPAWQAAGAAPTHGLPGARRPSGTGPGGVLPRRRRGGRRPDGQLAADARTSSATTPPAVGWSPAATRSPRRTALGADTGARQAGRGGGVPERAPTPAGCSTAVSRSRSPPAISTRPSQVLLAGDWAARDAAAAADPAEHGFDRVARLPHGRARRPAGLPAGPRGARPGATAGSEQRAGQRSTGRGDPLVVGRRTARTARRGARAPGPARRPRCGRPSPPAG